LRDDGAGLGDGGRGVVRETRVDFSGDASGNDIENLFAEGDGQPLKGQVGDGLRLGVLAQLVAGCDQHAIDDGLIVRLLGGGGDQRGVGGRVLGAEAGDRLDVAGVGDDDGKLAQLIK